MTDFFWLAFLLIFGLVNAGPQLLYLKKYYSDSEHGIIGVEDGGKLFVASNDDRALLRNIVITSGSTTTTLDRLADMNSDGTPKNLTIDGQLIIRSSNNDADTSKLTGYIYVTTWQQARDPSFGVYVITEEHYISRMGMRTTTVILNTAYKSENSDPYSPLKTSYVTGINHSHNTNLYFSWGVPSSNYTYETDKMFFKNPLVFNNYDEHGKLCNTSRIFFDNVEPLQIGIESWYFESMGPVNMIIKNQYVSATNYSTTAVNTTGLIVNDFIYQPHQVNFQWDLTRQSFVGTLVSTINLTSPVEFLLDGAGIVSQVYDGSMGPVLSESQFPAARLLVNSTNLLPGTFYCQYYGFSGDLLSTIATTPTTPAPVTTSKDSPGNAISTSTIQTSTRSSFRYQTILNFSMTFLIYAILN